MLNSKENMILLTRKVCNKVKVKSMIGEEINKWKRNLMTMMMKKIYTVDLIFINF
jgi:hypothetical protein